MNICYIHFGDLTENSAPSIHVREVVKNLALKNTVVLLVENGEVFHDNVSVVHVKVPKIKGVTYLFTVLYSFIYLRKLINNNKIDVIYCRDFFSGFSAIILSKMKKIPFIFEMNGILSEEAKIKKHNRVYIFLIKTFERFVFRNSDAFICVTEKLKKFVEEKYNRKNVYFVPNGVNTELFKSIKNAKKLLKLDENYFYVGFVGSFAPWQGLDILVKSASEILKEIPNVKFLVIGNGAEKKKLMKTINGLSLQEDFTFIGRIPYKNVPKYINACDICVAPFVKERNERIGLSALKIYEYASCGKPIASSRIPNLEFIEDQNTGILVEPENPQKLSKAIIKLLKNEELRKQMGENGRKYVVKNHSWKKIAERIEEILLEVISRDE